MELTRWRADTPGTMHRNHLNHLSNAGAALMPAPVIEAITEHIELEATIGGYEAACYNTEDEVDAAIAETAYFVSANAGT
jgi:selenocysteine lyase/cysteine desulfurase